MKKIKSFLITEEKMYHKGSQLRYVPVMIDAVR